jgi:hypothetical protein
MLTQAKREKRRFSSIPFTTWHYKKVSGQHHAPAALTPGKKAGAHFMGGWVRLGAGIKRHGKSPPPPTKVFLVLYPYFFVLIVLDIAFCPYCKTYTTQTYMPSAGFEAANPVSDRSQTVAFERSSTGIDSSIPGTSSQKRVAIPTELSRTPKICPAKKIVATVL